MMKIKPARRLTVKEVVDHLRVNDLISDKNVEDITGYTRGLRTETSSPWYIKILHALGAWISAVFFIAFIFESKIITNDTTQLIVFGIALIAAGVMINFKSKESIFLGQFALALSTAGHVLVLMGVSDWSKHEITVIFGASIVLCLILYPLYNNFLHRFLSCFLVLGLAVIFVLSELKGSLWVHLLVLVEAVGLGLVMKKRPYSDYWAPVFYALILGIPLQLFPSVFSFHDMNITWWPSNVILIAALLGLYLGKIRGNKETIIVVLLASAVLGVLSSPGLLASIGLLVIGYHLQKSPLVSAGLVLFPFYIFFFYNKMDMRLDIKSGILAATGLVLLALRFYLGRIYRSKGVQS